MQTFLANLKKPSVQIYSTDVHDVGCLHRVLLLSVVNFVN